MENICDYKSCTGCMACVNTCTPNAISMLADEEGFLRPCVDQNLCKECGLCAKICPVNTPVSKNDPVAVFSGWSKNETVRLQSASGGAFSEIAIKVIHNGGVIFGCMLDEDQNAVHTFVDNEVDLAKLQGSKYVQSYIGESFKQAKAFLKEGRNVLFSGTPCQIAGLKTYLRKDYENLLTVDIVCHGVPSPRVWHDYKVYLEKKHLEKVKHVVFRSKRFSWLFYGLNVTFENPNKNYFGYFYNDPYICGFHRDYFLRPSCEQCQYTTTNRVSDFTVADWWGYKKQNLKDKDFQKKGVSLLLVNSKKAQALLSDLNMDIQERSLEDAKKTNRCLNTSFPSSPLRKQFWLDYNEKKIEDIISLYMQPTNIPKNLDFLQRHENVDVTLMLAKILFFPYKVFNKVKNTLMKALNNKQI